MVLPYSSAGSQASLLEHLPTGALAFQHMIRTHAWVPPAPPTSGKGDSGPCEDCGSVALLSLAPIPAPPLRTGP